MPVPTNSKLANAKPMLRRKAEGFCKVPATARLEDDLPNEFMCISVMSRFFLNVG
jgi:hypothetical protein